MAVKKVSIPWTFNYTQEMYSHKYDDLLEYLQAEAVETETPCSSPKIKLSSYKRMKWLRGNRENTRAARKLAKPKLQLSHSKEVEQPALKLNDVVHASSAINEKADDNLPTMKELSDTLSYFPPILATKKNASGRAAKTPSNKNSNESGTLLERPVRVSRASAPSKTMNKSPDSLPTSVSPSSPRKKKKKLAVTGSEGDHVEYSPRVMAHRKMTRELTRKLHVKSQQADFHERLPPKGTPTKHYTTPNILVRGSDEAFSIRKKIEQFKKWHKDQYKDKLEKLKLESEQIQETESSGKRASLRQLSAKTWRTFRDINESDAYNDVKKYIEDNELMTPEKEKWIKQWLINVAKAEEKVLKSAPEMNDEARRENSHPLA